MKKQWVSFRVEPEILQYAKRFAEKNNLTYRGRISRGAAIRAMLKSFREMEKRVNDLEKTPVT